LRGAFLGLRNDLPRPATCFGDLLVCLLRGNLQRLFAFFGGRETVGNGFLAGFDGAQEMRPDELDRKPDERDEDNRLRE